MSFSAFSKQFTANMYTSVENQFITKYLPFADGDAVKVYLYGLYLCNCKESFDSETCAKLLHISYEKLLEAFTFWEECDLVHILSKDPLYVEYLPVNATIGKPKPIRPEKYAEFNRELLKLLQRAGKDFKPYEMQRILEFLENSPFEQQAFLLVAEYCAKKDGAKVTSAHMLNKAKKLCEDHKYTYEQVEQEFAAFNIHESELKKLYDLLGIYKKPQENDYNYLTKWATLNVEFSAIELCASFLKKGSFSTLDALVCELHDKQITNVQQAKQYLKRREELSDVVYQVARKLGIKIQNPRSYVETYSEKWCQHGFKKEDLLQVASFAFKMHYGFEELDMILDTLYNDGMVSSENISSYCSAREKQLKLLQSIQSICGIIKKTLSSLDTIALWKNWNFTDSMILEAAKRSANASAPLPYMNKLLTEWKNADIYDVKNIPDKVSLSDNNPKTTYRNEATIAADQRSTREHYYAVLRQNAMEKAENNKRRAQADEQFAQSDSILKRGEIELARAEIFSPKNVATIKKELELAQKARDQALKRLNLSEEDFIPKFTCEKCSDSGFLPNGKVCNCYKE